MDFFQSQDVARKNTTKLVLFFTMAVVSMIVLTNVLVMFAFGYMETEPGQPMTMQAFNWDIFVTVGCGVLLLVTLGSLYKIISLSGGGARVAEMMNGQLIVDDTGDADKQRILNVVEEMAIASGVPVPPVYLMDEEAINAFAAGTSPSDAVIGITRGAIRRLSRDELQGVIAHEFSHILNGDMKLNIRLIGLLHGILLLGLIGYFILRGSMFRSRDSKNGGGVLALGIGLIVIGYTGTFFGNLIKAAVSRQREFLADAAAVQFTRNPDGIGRALMRIGGRETAGVLENPKSAEISHAFFCEGVTSSFGSVMATHPPLEERIKRIVPTWDGEFLSGSAKPARKAKKKPVKNNQKKQQAMGMAAAAVLTAENVTSQVGQPTMAHLGFAKEFLQKLPPLVKQAVHNAHGARAAVYLMVLDRDEKERLPQLQYLQKEADAGVYAEMVRLAPVVTGFPRDYYLPLLDLALSALRQLSEPQYIRFKKNLQELVESDGKLSPFEWAVQKIILHHLGEVFERKQRRQQKEPNLKRTKVASAILLSFLASATKQDGITGQQAFSAASKELSWLDSNYLNASEYSLDDLDLALDDLCQLKPKFKASLIKGCVAVVMADKRISDEEQELLRAIADSLDCPIPPLLEKG
jgi:Zn-dependent protease with chaperone function/uncharacterized tellurite resistance protein B-like protein